MKVLSQATLLGLLQMYETALAELEKMHDQSVSGLIRRMERHRAEVISVLAARYMPADDLAGGASTTAVGVPLFDGRESRQTPY